LHGVWVEVLGSGVGNCVGVGVGNMGRYIHHI